MRLCQTVTRWSICNDCDLQTGKQMGGHWAENTQSGVHRDGTRVEQKQKTDPHQGPKGGKFKKKELSLWYPGESIKRQLNMNWRPGPCPTTLLPLAQQPFCCTHTHTCLTILHPTTQEPYQQPPSLTNPISPPHPNLVTSPQATKLPYIRQLCHPFPLHSIFAQWPLEVSLPLP